MNINEWAEKTDIEHEERLELGLTVRLECEVCNGTGKEICDNPDHGLMDIGRIGCPCCGHDENHAIPNTTCEACNGTGEVDKEEEN